MSLTRDLARLNIDSDGDISVSGTLGVNKTLSVGSNTNLLSNAEFTTNTTGWAATTSTLAIVSNELQLTPDGGANGFANQQVDNLVVGKSYIASVTVTVDAAGYSRLYIGTSANGNQTLSNVNLGTGTHSFIFTATATTHHFALVVGGGTGQVTRFDNAKLIEANKVIFPAGYGKVDGILAVDRATNEGDVIDVQKDGTSVGSIGVSGGNNMYLSGQANNHAGVTFATQSILPTTQGTINNNTVDLGQNGNAYKDLYLGGGLYVGGTGAVNKLDDYEEGTWTASAGAVSGATQPTVEAGTFYGTYTKIGRVVHAAFYVGPFRFSGTLTSTLAIKGLPFAHGGGDSTNGVAITYYITWARPEFVALRIYSGTEAGFLSVNNGGNWGWEACSAAGTGYNRYISGTIQYTVA